MENILRKQDLADTKVISLQGYINRKRTVRPATKKPPQSTGNVPSAQNVAWYTGILEKYLFTDDGIFQKSPNPNGHDHIQLTNFNFCISSLLTCHDRAGSEVKKIQYSITLGEENLQAINCEDYEPKLISEIQRNFPAAYFFGSDAKGHFKKSWPRGMRRQNANYNSEISGIITGGNPSTGA